MDSRADQLVALLERIDLFESFHAATLQQVALHCPSLCLDSGQILFPVGQEGSSLFIVVDGQLKVYRGERVIALINRGEYIGEMALFDPGPRSASVRAVRPTQVIEVARSVYDRFLANEPHALAAMMRTMIRRQRNTLNDTQAAYEQVNLQVHDMLNLVNVLASAALIEDALPPDDENQRFVRMIMSVQERLAEMMRSALRRARDAVGVYAKVPTDLEKLVRDCVDTGLALHPDVGKVRVEVDVPNSLPSCLCNDGDIRRVVENLLINAAQAAPGGDVRICLSHAPGVVRLAVQDNGAGIGADTLPRIFEAHFTTKTDGNGLGLASCRQIIETLHGGRLRCESTLGKGTTFTCELPAS